METRILITGSNGLTGQKIVHLLLSRPDVRFLATSKGRNRVTALPEVQYRSMDITDEAQVLACISNYLPTAVINTAGMTNVDTCQEDQQGCDALNVLGVQYLINACEGIGAHLIHLSTDFVFDGSSGPYSENDKPNPLSYYGRSKWKGEQLVLDSNIRSAVLRTILVYGTCESMSRSNVVLWAKQALAAGKPMRVVDDQFRCPTLAEDLAQACVAAVDRAVEGVYHISGKDFMSVYQLVERVAKYFQLDFSQVVAVSSQKLKEKAPRPARTGFIIGKAVADLDYAPRSFEEGLQFLETQLS